VSVGDQNADKGDARARALDAAERIFTRKGFAAVKLREISAELGLSHASLYYHFPGGKEELFAAVMERNILRHGAGLAEAITSGGQTLRGKLRGVAAWLLSLPPMDLIRMAETDMPSLPEDVARRLMTPLFEQMIVRLRPVLKEAVERGEVAQSTDAGLVAGAFIGLVENLHSVPRFAVTRSRVDMANDLIDIVLKGLDYREGGSE
jgi:TetR/AcrR family transcriptional regulator, cholesterol catabolism regulator